MIRMMTNLVKMALLSLPPPPPPTSSLWYEGLESAESSCGQLLLFGIVTILMNNETLMCISLWTSLKVVNLLPWHIGF